LTNQQQNLNWLKVVVLDGENKASLYGAEVRVYHENSNKLASAVAVIDGGSGFCSQNPYETYIGLGSGEGKFDVTVKCGTTLVDKTSQPQLGGLDPNQKISATCDSRSRIAV